MEFEKARETIVVDPPGRLIVGVYGAASAIDLACDGRGVIATFENWLAPAFEAGKLQPLLPNR